MSNIKWVTGLYEAFGRGDIPAVLGAFDPNISWSEAENNPYQPDGSAWIGPDAVVQNLFMRLADDWESFTVTPKQFHDAGSTVVVEGRYSGTAKATGKSIDAQFCHVWGVSGEKITSFQQYVDTAQLNDVLGASA